MVDSTTGQVESLEEIKSGFLTKSEYIALYDICGGILHADNPFSPKRDIQSFLDSVPAWMQKIMRLRPNQVRAADITYLPMARGFLYPVAVMDWYSRYVVS